MIGRIPGSRRPEATAVEQPALSGLGEADGAAAVLAQPDATKAAASAVSPERRRVEKSTALLSRLALRRRFRSHGHSLPSQPKLGNGPTTCGSPTNKLHITDS